jgi:hypothetical protein
MPARYDVREFGAVGDAKRVSDGAIRVASRDHLTSATAGFTGSDRGKIICIEAPRPERSSLSTTIAEVISARQIRLADAASIAADLVDAQITWGTDNADAIREATTASGASSVFFPPGGYCLGSPVTFNAPVEFAPGASLLPSRGSIITVNQEILAPKDATIFDVTCGGAFKIDWTGEIIANWWSGGDIGARVNHLLASIDLRQPRPLGRMAQMRIVGDADLTTPIDSLRLGATENAIHIDASRPDQSPGHIAVRNAHFEFMDIEAFRCTGDVRMEQKVDIITRGDEDAPQIILGQDFNGEIWGGAVEKLHVASRLMTGLYHDGVTNVVHEFKYWPMLTFADMRDEHGEARPIIAGGLRSRRRTPRPPSLSTSGMVRWGRRSRSCSMTITRLYVMMAAVTASFSKAAAISEAGQAT